MPSYQPISRVSWLSLTKKYGLHAWRGQIRELFTGIQPTISLGREYHPAEEAWFAGSAFVDNDKLSPVPGVPPVLSCSLLNPPLGTFDVIVYSVTCHAYGLRVPLPLTPVIEFMMYTPTFDATLGDAMYLPTVFSQHQHTPGVASAVGKTEWPAGYALLTSGYNVTLPRDLGSNDVQGVRSLTTYMMETTGGLPIANGPGQGAPQDVLYDGTSARPPLILVPGRSLAVSTLYGVRSVSIPMRLVVNFSWGLRERV